MLTNQKLLIHRTAHRSFTARVIGGLLAAALAACGNSPQSATVLPLPEQACAPGTEGLEITGPAEPSDAKTFVVQPFTVGPGTGRVEVGYTWTERAGPPGSPLSETTLDLGLWDQRGYRSQPGFRGWGGSRQGRLDRDQAPVFVQAADAERGFTPGPVQPGTWWVEIGIAAVSPQGADWLVRIECKAATGTLAAADPVDATHMARDQAGWYHGDFHMHAYHSNPQAPDWDEFVQLAREVQLDFLMVTEYVTGRHWQTLGAVQRAHPDLVIWPGREIITYFGHVNSLGETPGFFEYRHGFEDVDIGDIQQQIKAAGALFQVAHPTFFPGPLFENFCRGCEFQLGDRIDWNQVDTIEILTGPVLATADDIGIPLPGGQSMENPFMATAIHLWEDLLTQGYRITAVSGSDSKGVESDFERRGYGTNATAVFASQLSRPALTAALQAGHAYVRTRGVGRSPEVEFEAEAPDGSRGIYGDTLHGDSATLRTTVRGGLGQVLTYIANGEAIAQVPILTDPFTHELPATRIPATEGPLGTFWRIEVRDAQSRTIVGNPVFLRGGGGG